MILSSNSFKDGQAIPVEFAFGKHHARNRVELSENRNPHLQWSEAPEGTKSFALICHDPDVPSVGDQVNKEGMTVPESLPRVDFFHWILVDIPHARLEIKDGEFSREIVGGGKPGPEVFDGMRQGTNSYTQWFAGDADMDGQYFGYDGPCPPWNDEIIHHYHFTLYALDIDKLEIDGAFDGPAALAAIEGHILAKAQIVGTYAIYPEAKLRG